MEVSFSYSSYYSHDFSQDSFYFEIGNKKYDLSYKNVLYDETSYSSINVVFNIDNSNLFIKEGYQIEVKFVEEIFQGVFYIEDIMILEPGVELTLNYVENGTIKNIRVFCERVIDQNYYIISGMGLKEGMKLYV